MPTVLEPIGAGLVVAIFNRYILSGWLWNQLAGCGPQVPHREDEAECVSSSSTSATDAVEIHAHF